MTDNNSFFESQSEQYTQMDFLCGPGVYEKGEAFVPLKIIRSVIADSFLFSRMALFWEEL